MEKDDYDYLMTFTSHHRATLIFERLKRKNIRAKLVTAPNKIHISCTQAIKFYGSDSEEIKREWKINNIYPTAVFKIVREGKKESYEKAD